MNMMSLKKIKDAFFKRNVSTEDTKTEAPVTDITCNVLRITLQDGTTVTHRIRPWVKGYADEPWEKFFEWYLENTTPGLPA